MKIKLKNHIYIIAEAGVNHNGSIAMAKQLVDAAADAGADAVKFQTFKAEALVSASAPKAEYQKAATDRAESQLDMLRRLELDEAAHRTLANHCKTRHIQFLSTPFDEESLYFLTQKIAVPFLKLPSGEITNAPFLLKAARTKRPIILSTGMSTLAEVRTALGVLAFGYTRSNNEPSLTAFQGAYRSDTGKAALKRRVTLLHCTTEYPAAFSDANLRAMGTMRMTFGLPVGFSDHTPGIAVSVAAAALGATVIEKHVTLDRNLPGPDHKASLDPGEFQSLVKSVREVESALGSAEKLPTKNELKNLRVARRSLVAMQDIARGERFTSENIGCKRPGTGLSPVQYWRFLGRKTGKQYHKDERVKP
jgi:N-acetylneuraminate synthase